MNLGLPSVGNLDQPTGGDPVVDLPTGGGHDKSSEDVDIEFIRLLKKSMKQETIRRVKAKRAAKKSNDVAMISEEEKKEASLQMVQEIFLSELLKRQLVDASTQFGHE